MSTHAYAHTQTSEVLRYLQNRPTVGETNPYRPMTNHCHAPGKEFTAPAATSRGSVTSTSNHNCDTSARMLSCRLSSGYYLKLLPSPVSLYIPTAVSFVSSLSPHKLLCADWPSCSMAEAAQHPWATSSEQRCPLKPSSLLEFCIFSTPGHSCCSYTSFFNPCLHIYSWVKLQYLALSLVSKEWIPCTFLHCCSAQWLNTRLTNKITGNKCYLY